MHIQNPCANTTVSRASGGPTSRTANSTSSSVVTTLARSKSRSVKSSVACGSSARSRLAIERAADTPATVPTVASPATPAIHRGSLARRGCSPLASLASFSAFFAAERVRRSSMRFVRLARFALSGNGSTLTVDAGDPAAGSGDHLIMDGVERVGPVLGCGLAVGAGPEQYRGVALAHTCLSWSKVDDELVHADPADVWATPPVDQHVEATAERAVHTVGVTDRQQRQCGVAVRGPDVPVGHSVTGMHRFDKHHRASQRHRGDQAHLPALRDGTQPVHGDAGPDHVVSQI